MSAELSDGMVLNEIQLLLAEERTAMSAMRTGIAVLALPLSVLSLLVATSRFYDPLGAISFLVPLALMCTGLLLFGGYLVARSARRLWRLERLVHKIKLEHSAIAEFLDTSL